MNDQQRADAREAVAAYLMARGLFRAAMFNIEKCVQHRGRG